MLLAEALVCAGHDASAREELEQAEAAMRSAGDVVLAAEIERRRAPLLLHYAGGGLPAAEACLAEALAIARRQGALALELRAARDLAGLWADGGRRRRAFDILAPVYGAFSEGFATADLIEAKALLDDIRD